MKKRLALWMMIGTLGLVFSQPLSSAGIINENAQAQHTKLPVSCDVYVVENVTVRFETLKDVKESLRGPYPIDPEALKLIVRKFDVVLGESLYPSQLAHLFFEVAFTDPLSCRLTQQQRTENIGYALSNLGAWNSQLSTYLFAFYYGYSFQYGAPPKTM